MTPGLASSLLEAIEAIDEVGLRYAIVACLAVGAWGVSRSTRDADLYAELPSSHRAELQHALQSRGYDVPAMNEELARFGVFRSKSKVGGFVDVFDAVGPFGEQLLARRTDHRVRQALVGYDRGGPVPAEGVLRSTSRLR